MSVYVLSDIHGLYSRFITMLDTIKFNENDHLYILGDVIDRGNNGIQILQYVMKHKNITLLMGNHEYMMLQYYETLKTTQPDQVIIDRWHRNGCKPTIEAFNQCSKDEQEQILAYLTSLPLAISDLEVNQHMFYLVHGAPIISLKNGTVDLCSDIMKLFRVEDLVWERIVVENLHLDDRILIVGHTITAFYHNVRPYQIWHDQDEIQHSKMIAIDCGCACDDKFTQLACLRLDDFNIFYT